MTQRWLIDPIVKFSGPNIFATFFFHHARFVEIPNWDNMAGSKRNTGGKTKGCTVSSPSSSSLNVAWWIGIPIKPPSVSYLFPWSGNGCRSDISSVVTENQLPISRTSSIMHRARIEYEDSPIVRAYPSPKFFAILTLHFC